MVIGKVSGWNIAEGLERFKGSMEDYTSALREYAKDIRSLLKTIEDIDKRWLNSYRLIIRSIKGASFEISADQIGDMARGLERAADVGNIEYIRKHNPIFLDAVHKFLDQLDTALTKIDTESKVESTP